MRKALMNASVASMIYKFNMRNIGLLEELGFSVDVACNTGGENPMPPEWVDDFENELAKKQIRLIKTDCPRRIYLIGDMIKTYRQLRRLSHETHYDIIHTQSPIGGVLCRLAFRHEQKKGTKIIYEAHGFHFYKGAPLAGRLIFYPIEKLCSRFTDVLITINTEDYELAKNKFHAHRVEYVPGVGLDLRRFNEGEDLTKKKQR